MTPIHPIWDQTCPRDRTSRPHRDSCHYTPSPGPSVVELRCPALPRKAPVHQGTSRYINTDSCGPHNSVLFYISAHSPFVCARSMVFFFSSIFFIFNFFPLNFHLSPTPKRPPSPRGLQMNPAWDLDPGRTLGAPRLWRPPCGGTTISCTTSGPPPT